MSERTKTSVTGAAAARAARIWNGQSFEIDLWRQLRDDEALPADGLALVSIARWRAERTELSGREPGTIGVYLVPNDDIDPQNDELQHLALIVLPFPKFTDGRSYSTARRLRELWGYANELRATGDILLDQLPLMARCGFTSFGIADAATIRALERSAPTRMSRMYQSPALHGDLRRRATSPRVLAAVE